MRDVIPINADVDSLGLQAGDILAFYGADWRSRAIELRTWGPSHVGIVVDWTTSNPDGSETVEKLLIESTTMCPRPCAITGQHIDGVQGQRPRLRIEDYDGRAKVFRVAPQWKLTDEDSRLLTWLCREFWLGRPYNYGGALWSGTWFLKFWSWLPHSDDGALFCSQLIAASLQRLGLLCVTNAGEYDPGLLVRSLVRAGTYLRGVPL